jgi:hypothetical protein
MFFIATLLECSRRIVPVCNNITVHGAVSAAPTHCPGKWDPDDLALTSQPLPLLCSSPSWPKCPCGDHSKTATAKRSPPQQHDTYVICRVHIYIFNVSVAEKIHITLLYLTLLTHQILGR